jgi:hypothetical protein
MINIKIVGVEPAVSTLRLFKEGAERLGGLRILVGSNLKYAYGIEYGRHRGGRLARRAGGAYMLQKGFDSVVSTLKQDISQALATNGSVYDAVFKNALRAETVTKENTPVKTGSLRRSFHTVSEGR